MMNRMMNPMMNPMMNTMSMVHGSPMVNMAMQQGLAKKRGKQGNQQEAAGNGISFNGQNSMMPSNGKVTKCQPLTRAKLCTTYDSTTNKMSVNVKVARTKRKKKTKDVLKDENGRYKFKMKLDSDKGRKVKQIKSGAEDGVNLQTKSK